MVVDIDSPRKSFRCVLSLDRRLPQCHCQLEKGCASCCLLYFPSKRKSIKENMSYAEAKATVLKDSLN